MITILGSVKIRGRTTLLNLYEVDMKNKIATIGVANNTPKTIKDIRTNSDGYYIVHGCYKYYLSEFKRSDIKDGR